MKKILILLLTVSMVAAAFIGCSDKPEKISSFGLTSEDTNGNFLRDDVELEILKYRFGKKADPKKCDIQYFGAYKDMLLLKLYVAPKKGTVIIDDTNYETIAGFEFSFTGKIVFNVWVNGELHDLKEAYESGILTADDIKYIHQRASGHCFYGPYSGAIVAQVWEPGGSPDAVNYENIAGYQFQFSGRMKIQVIYNEEKYDLKEAYESGILTDNDIEAFFADYSNVRYYDDSKS
ncbi:MAG: hypothetical protein E7648_02030 [Ruminococcaceae bacterium]|nr:hypothetical protein [Oscillospiraceae bacterium]MBO5039483.1 hypothetical protein [Clostridia bacterium]